MNSSSISLNLTPANLTIKTAYLHIHQSVPLAPTISMPPHITESPAPYLLLQLYLPPTPLLILSDSELMAHLDLPVDVNKLCELLLFNPENIVMKNLEDTTQLGRIQ